MAIKYIPKQGDICYVNFSPTEGHEQAGLRPAIVVSNNDYIKLTKMVLLCPITTNTKPFPTHYKLINSKKVKGSVLCEHVRSIDYNAIKLSFVEKVTKEELLEIIDLLSCLIEN